MDQTLNAPEFRLRAFQAQDAGAVAALCDDFDVARMTRRLPHPYTLKDAEEFLSGVLLAEPKEVVFAIEARDRAGADAFCLAGACGWMPRVHEGRVEIGYWLGRSFWGRGLMSAAVAQLLRRAFAEPSLTLVVGSVFEDNPASARILEKLGFVRNGEDDCRSSARGVNATSYRWELTRNAWEARALEQER